MSAGESDLARGGPGFPATAWSVIRGAQREDEAARARALDRLLSVYWRPVYWTLRLDWNAPPEEAKDRTQEFFASLLERRSLGDVDAARGRFRSFVKASLKHFMLDARRAESTRRGRFTRRIVALEDLPRVEADATAVDARPDVRFERELMRAILARAREDLERGCERAGRADHFALFEAFHLDGAEAPDGERPTYDALARRFGVGYHEVKNRLADLRARYRKLVLGYLKDGTTTEEELAAEIREVFEP